MSIFRKDKNPLSGKPNRAVAFVDYEHWYISLYRNYGIKPNIGLWFDDMRKRVNLTDAIFFADFSHQSLADEMKRIRIYSNSIVDTRSGNGNSKKDFTDFIMLDHIYRKALTSDDTDVFILLTGDGHFSSAVSFLKNIYSKEVGIYGVTNSFSRQLRETASWSIELPFADEITDRYNKLVFDCIIEYEKKAPGQVATLTKITEIASNKQNVSSNELDNAINKLTESGYLSLRRIGMKTKSQENALFVDWNKVKRDEIYLKGKA